MTRRDHATRWVVVLGPPGSGGDLVAGALAGAGFVDESAAVTAANDAALTAERASRLAPPAGEIATGELVVEGKEGFRTAEGATAPVGAVAYDAATALTLGAWRASGRHPDLVVLVGCEPWSSVDALARAGVGAALALALWDHYTRATHTAPIGLPVVVVDGDALARGRSDAADQLGPLFEALGLGVEAVEAWSPPVDRAAGRPRPAGSDLGGVGIPLPVRGRHERWIAPGSPPAPRWCDELLDAVSRAHRATLEARDAWQALDEQRRAAPAEDPAVTAVRERELWRLRDHTIGLEVELAEVRARAATSDAEQRAAEGRADALAQRLVEESALAASDLHAARDQLITSPQWRVGRVIVGPFLRVRRWFGSR